MSEYTNAFVEFINHTSTVPSQVKCAKISNIHYSNDCEKHYLLPLNYTPEQYSDFCRQLDFQYNSGYGSQYLDGTIWYEDGTWSSRSEYDGSEWWVHNSCPSILDELR